MKIYLSIFLAMISMISCDKEDDTLTLTSDNTFSLDDIKFETPYCFLEDWGIEGGNRDFREYTILLASDDHDGDPFVLDNPNTHVTTFVLFSPSLTELESGEYTQSTAIDNKICNKEWKPGTYLGISAGTELQETAR